MKRRLNDWEERNKADLDAIREKYGAEAKHRRAKIYTAELRVEVRKAHLQELEEQREQYRGIITYEALQEWNRLSSAMANQRQKIEAAKRELGNLLMEQ